MLTDLLLGFTRAPGRSSQWSAFASDAPELAAAVQDVLARHGFAFASTIRSDGSPRISPIEVHVSAGRLFVVLIPRTATVWFPTEIPKSVSAGNARSAQKN